MQILENLKNGILKDEENERAYELLSEIPQDNAETVHSQEAFESLKPNILNPKDDITKRTDKTKYLTDNEIEQVNKDSGQFKSRIEDFLNGRLSPKSRITVLEKLPSAYNSIENLKGKKVIIQQSIYAKIIDLPNKHKKNHNIDRKRALKLPELISDPLYILQSVSEGKEHRYIAVTNTKGKNPGERLSVIIELKNDAVIVSAYDEAINISEERKAGRILYDKKKELSKTFTASKTVMIDSSDNTITHFQEKLNPSVTEHEDNNIHFQAENNRQNNNEKTAEDENSNPYEIFNIDKNGQRQLFSPEKKKLYRIKGAFLTGMNFIQHFEGKDRSTILHESAHWYLDILTKSAKHNPKIAEKLEAVRKFLKNNGEEFTYGQHEKFAHSFEAYIRSGNARNNRLKQVFEDFKNFLMQIYDGIKALGIKEEEMPEINALFDDLFSAENERIKSAVFDRCNILQEQITALKTKQEQEFKEIEEIEQRNLKNIMQKKEFNSEVQKNLKLAEKAAERVPASVKEQRARYKDVTFQILEAATGYKRQFIANPKNWEKVKNAISHTDDKITASNGFIPAWGEFYADTGVSYNNDETGADETLAQQAFKVLQSGSFEFGETDDKAIGRFFGMFDYLSAKVLSSSGAKKEYAFQALSSLFENMPAMPDEAVLEIAEKFNQIQDSYADEKLKGFKDFEKFENIPLHIELQTYILHKLQEMKSYDPEAKRIIRLSSVNRLYKLVRNINTSYMAKDAVREINNFAIGELENKI